MPKVSVIVPTHNYGRFLPASVGSALRQTSCDLEVIIVDDGSTDETPSVIQQLATDARIRAIRSPNREGPAAARNRGLACARADYVAMLDADDWWCSDKLAAQVGFLDAHREVGFVHSLAAQVGRQGELLYPMPWLKGGRVSPAICSAPASGSALVSLLLNNSVATSSVLARRALVQAVGGFAENLPVCEDWDLWLRLAARMEVGCVSEWSVYIRRHGANTHLDVARMVRSSLQVLEEVPRKVVPWEQIGIDYHARAIANVHRRAAAACYEAGAFGAAGRHLLYATICDPRHAQAWDLRMCVKCLLYGVRASRRR
jgi:glycosyltransferase involved in cell wall biosynthesis